MKTFQIPKCYMGLRYFKDLVVDWSKVLKQILKKQSGKTWPRLIRSNEYSHVNSGYMELV